MLGNKFTTKRKHYGRLPWIATQVSVDQTDVEESDSSVVYDVL